MKKTMLFSSALVALAMLASCQKEQPIETPATTTGVTEFTATIESTKTVIASDGKVTWEKGDKITVTDAESKSADYEAASSGATTTFTLMTGQTAVGSGPYTATYGDITKQVYDANGANCPLEANTADAGSTTLHFSSPYAVLKITAKSSDGEKIKKVVVEYGNSSSILDCDEEVKLTSGGVDFYVAVRPSTEDAALSVSFYTADKMATRTRKSGVPLAAKDLLSVTFESLTWSPQKTFKAVYNSTNTTLTFYYDNVDHSGDGITVYEDGTANWLFDNTKNNYEKWGYNNKRQNIKSVVIDSSVDGYKGLTSTAYMFHAMTNASSISGAEYLDVSNVTDMSNMFANFGQQSTDLNEVPNVSGWKTGKVEYMNKMFYLYGSKNMSFNAVPCVSGWDTGNVRTMKQMFDSFANSSKDLNTVPDVSKWSTDNVTDMNSMFKNYGGASESLNAVPNVSRNSNYWNTSTVIDMACMFQQYGKSSTVLNKVPDVSNWNTIAVETLKDMFHSYGETSKMLEEVPNVGGSTWKTDRVTNMEYMFQNYGNGSVEFTLDLSNWNLANLPDNGGNGVFDCIAKEFDVKIPGSTSGKTNTGGHWYYGTGNNNIEPAKKSADPNNRWEFNPISAN